MNYLNKTEVPTELLHQKALEELGWIGIRLQPEFDDEGKTYTVVCGCPPDASELDKMLAGLKNADPLDDNLCRKLREKLTDNDYYKMGNGYEANLCSLLQVSMQSDAFTWRVLNASPETHLRAMMQALQAEPNKEQSNG